MKHYFNLPAFASQGLLSSHSGLIVRDGGKL